MSKASVFTLILAFSLTITSCSAYRSSGRENFEKKVPASAVAAADTDTTAAYEMNEDVCWNQPINDPLWHLTPTSSMTVTQISEDEIQVCAIQL